MQILQIKKDRPIVWICFSPTGESEEPETGPVSTANEEAGGAGIDFTKLYFVQKLFW
jgi:hypothetical protein